MKSEVVEDGRGNVMADYSCTDCGRLWTEWVPMRGELPRAAPRRKRRCDDCIKRHAAPTLLAAWEKLQGGAL